MGKTWKLVFTGAATIAALSTGGALYAQPEKLQSGAGTMQGSGQMKGMMNMMGQMNQMMEGCNKMMQDMNAHQSTDKPADKPSSEKSK